VVRRRLATSSAVKKKGSLAGSTIPAGSGAARASAVGFELGCSELRVNFAEDREDARAIRERIGYSESAEASRTPVCPRLR
jgi:hypothetical protein